jgi:hypothetical protein
MAFEIGTRIHADISGRVTGSVSGGQGSTTEVTQVDDPLWAHFLYLGSPFVTGNKENGGKVKAVFDATVTGTYASGTYSTTPVQDKSGFLHFLYLNSEAVTVLPAETPEPVIPPVSTRPAPEKEKTVSIDRYDNTIDSSDVANRIEELESEQEYEVIRVRNDEVLATYEYEDDAEQYIVDEDYDRVRVIVRQQQLDSDDSRELERLRVLVTEVENYLSGPWTLYNEDFFDENWAQEQAKELLGVRYTGDWPLNQVNWDDAARERRDSDYPNEFTFDGVTFYAEEV